MTAADDHTDCTSTLPDPHDHVNGEAEMDGNLIRKVLAVGFNSATIVQALWQAEIVERMGPIKQRGGAQ